MKSVAFISLFVVGSSIFYYFVALTILAMYHGTTPDRSQVCIISKTYLEVTISKYLISYGSIEGIN